MKTPSSKSAVNRSAGRHQVGEQRARILEAAERLFLENGLEQTTMLEIAALAGITKVTLYRYFANRDEIALAIHVRMLQRIASLVEPEPASSALESERQRAQAMIRNFDRLRDAYRYIGMFDQIYLDQAPDATLAQWTKQQLTSSDWGRAAFEEKGRGQLSGNQLPVIMNTVIWFLEKLALRGELTWSDQAIPLEEHLRVFEELIMGYFDRIIEGT
jgi:AcrR family transcriptional regulator